MNNARRPPSLMETLPSQVPGIHWPAVVGARDAAVLALLFQMESTQWLSGQALHQRLYRLRLSGHSFATQAASCLA